MDRPILVTVPVTELIIMAFGASSKIRKGNKVFPVGSFIYGDHDIYWREYAFKTPLTADEITTKIEKAIAKVEGGGTTRDWEKEYQAMKHQHKIICEELAESKEK